MSVVDDSAIPPAQRAPERDYNEEWNKGGRLAKTDNGANLSPFRSMSNNHIDTLKHSWTPGVVVLWFNSRGPSLGSLSKSPTMDIVVVTV